MRVIISQELINVISQELLNLFIFTATDGTVEVRIVRTEHAERPDQLRIGGGKYGDLPEAHPNREGPTRQGLLVHAEKIDHVVLI